MRISNCIRSVVVISMFILAGCETNKSQSSRGQDWRRDETARLASAEAGPSRNVQNLPAPSRPPLVWNARDVLPVGTFEVVATIDQPMPTGVTVSRSGRIFVNFPKWGDPVSFTVAEIKDGKPVAFPDENINREDPQHPDQVLVSAQSVVVDAKDRLWILDTGSEKFGPAVEGGAKLVCVDLSSNRIVQKIIFSRDLAKEKTYLNDVRFDLRRGKEGFAFITDSSTEGENGIIVVDLESGKSWRRLNDHPSTKAERDFVPIVEGQPLMMRQPGQPPRPITFGSDGIAISSDGSRLYYCPLASRKLFSVSVDALVDQNQTDEQVAQTVEDLGAKCASDGLESDSTNRLYLTDYESAAIRRRQPNGRIEVILRDPQLIWPDTLSLADDGYLYFTVNQLDRMERFHDGKDMRTRPYAVCRIKVDASPVRLAN